jgi:uncharacterized membrane protein
MGAGHSHLQHSAPDRRTGRAVLAVIIPAALITLVALIWLWPPSVQHQPTQPGEAQQVTGVITAIESLPCPQTPEDQPGVPSILAGPNGCGNATVTLHDGPDEGENVTAELPAGPGSPLVKVGDEITLMYLSDMAEGNQYQIADHQRGNQLWILAAAFALAVVAFGRWRGLTALAGLGVTFGALLWFIVPAILAGRPPLLVAIVGSAAIMLTVLYLTHGPSLSTSVAVAGTLISLALTGILSAVAVSITHLTGLADENASYLGMTSQVNMQGLLLAGILIGSLGVLDDVTVTQAVTVDELARANPTYRFRQLYSAAIRIGRAHIASVINTIILAYAGASLPLLLLIATSNLPTGQVLTNQLIAEELVRSIVGTIGLIAAVPITTALAVLAATRLRRERPAPRPRHSDPDERLRALSGDWDDEPRAAGAHHAGAWHTAR